MNARHCFEELKKKPQSPKERAREMDYPSGLEVGLRHPTTAATILTRDDGVAEVASGPSAAVLVDGPNQQVTLKGSGIATQSEYLHLHTPPGGFYLNYQPFNSFWQTGNPGAGLLPGFLGGAVGEALGVKDLSLLDPTGQFIPRVAVPRGSGALPDASVMASIANFPLLTGVPAPGQTIIPLSALFDFHPLFGPSQYFQILSRNLFDLLRTLIVPGF